MSNDAMRGRRRVPSSHRFHVVPESSFSASFYSDGGRIEKEAYPRAQDTPDANASFEFGHFPYRR